MRTSIQRLVSPGRAPSAPARSDRASPALEAHGRAHPLPAGPQRTVRSRSLARTLAALLLVSAGPGQPGSGGPGAGPAVEGPPAPQLAAQAPGPREQLLRLEVRDRSGLFPHPQLEPRLYLASSAEGWAADGRAASAPYGPLDADGSSPGWVFELPRRLAESPDLAFKFTRGSWATVEVDASGRDISNRRLPQIEWPKGKDPARLRLELLRFADQDRPASAAGAPASTLVGRLEVFELPSEQLGDVRRIRVWLPASYGEDAPAGEHKEPGGSGAPRPKESPRRFPVLYMHDGQNCFDVATSAFGQEWRVDEALSALIEGGQLEPWIVVAVDNIGATRAADYNPTGLDVRGSSGRGGKYLAFLCEELAPAIEARYRADPRPERRALGGSSFGGNITLLALLERPGFFGRALVESPALWVGDGVLIERLEKHRGARPERLFIGMGGREYGDAERDRALVARAKELAAALGVSEAEPGAQKRLWIEAEGAHNETTWARRLPEALRTVLGPLPERR